MKSKAYSVLVGCALLIFLSPTVSMAQYKSVVMGVKVAPNLGWLKTDQEGYNSEGVVPGVNWGLIADFYFAENYALASGFEVSFHNGKISYPETYDGAPGLLNRKYRLKYIDIPVLIKMKTNDIGDFRFFGNIGVRPGIRIGAKADDTYTSLGGSTVNFTKDWHNIDSQTRLFRMSLVIGAGVEFPIDNSTSIVAGFNFINGFSNVLKGKNTVNESIRNKAIPNAIELMLGVTF